MSDVSKSPEHSVVCPLCEGKGQLPEDLLTERLSEKDLPNKIKSYIHNFVDAEIKTSPSEPGHKNDIDSWNLTHFLWRRSPKE